MTIKRTGALGTVGTVYPFESGAGQVDADAHHQRSGPIMKMMRMRIPRSNFQKERKYYIRTRAEREIL
jgi:hypothetical protein